MATEAMNKILPYGQSAVKRRVKPLWISEDNPNITSSMEMIPKSIECPHL